jgi:Tfp pilus assembly protein PilF
MRTMAVAAVAVPASAARVAPVLSAARASVAPVALVLAVAAALAIFTAPAAHASERSSHLVSRGLVHFHAGDSTQALDAFDKAVAADRRDAEARYYRGVTYGRMQRFAEAAADLEEVLELEPGFNRAKLELGYALFRLGRYDEAHKRLAQAQADPTLEPQASLFLGIIEVRGGHTEQAKADLERAAIDPQLAAAAHFYRGVAQQRAGEARAAATSFRSAAERAPDTEIAREAEQRAARLGTAPSARRYELYGALGFEYDSNVRLAPSDDALAGALGIAEDDDGVGTIEAGARYDVIREPSLRVSAGYEFFQSLHLDLDDFNLQDHRLGVDATGRAGRAIVGLATHYDYYLLKTDSFLEEISTAPWLRIPLGPSDETDLYYRFRYRDFKDEPFDSLRDAANHAVGLRWAHYFGARERYVALGYRFDHEEPAQDEGELFAYDGHEADAELGWMLPGAIASELSYAYRRENYEPSASNGRDDNEHLIGVELSRKLVEYFWLVAAYGGTINDSNREFFEHDRHVVSLALEMRY